MILLCWVTKSSSAYSSAEAQLCWQQQPPTQLDFYKTVSPVEPLIRISKITHLRSSMLASQR